MTARRVPARLVAVLLLGTAAAARAAGDSPDLAERTPARLLGPGETELQVLLNSYTQTRYYDDDGARRDAGGRATYHTLQASWTRGGDGLDWGVDAALRSVVDETVARRVPAAETDRRTALAWVAPRVEVAPWDSRPSVSVEASLRIPTARGLDGRDDGDADARDEGPFLDSGDPTLVARLRGERGAGGRSYWYGEVGAELRWDRQGPDGASTPIVAIYHTLPSPRWTLYLPVSVTPFWGGESSGSWSSQVGLGAKFRPSPGLEVESAVTVFPAGRNQGAGASMTLGARIVR